MKIFENIEKHNDKQRIIVLSNFIKKAEEQEEKIDEKESIKIPLDESNKSEKTEDDKATPEQVEKLKSFIKKNNYLDDEAFHIYAIEIGLNPHEAEEAIYQILHDSFSEEGINKILDGKSKNLTPEEIASEHGMTMDQLQRQINLGLKVEREHTKNEDAALAITLDHLVEDGRYYTNKKPKDWAEKEIKKEDKQELEEVKTEDEESEEVKKAIITEKGELMEKAYAEGTRVNFKDGWYVKTDGKWKKEQKKEKIVILKKYDEYFPISNVLLGQKVIYKGTSYWVQDGSDVHILLSKKKRKEEKTEKDFIKINQNQFNKDAQLTSEFDNDRPKKEEKKEILPHKALKFPSDFKAYSDGSGSWYKKGGYAGEKTIDRVREEALKQGWVETESKSLTTPSDIVLNSDELTSPDKKWKLKFGVRWGYSSSDNSFVIELRKLEKEKKPPTFGEFKDHIKEQFEQAAEEETKKRNGSYTNVLGTSLNANIAKPHFNKILGEGAYDEIQKRAGSNHKFMMEQDVERQRRRGGEIDIDSQDYVGDAFADAMHSYLREVYNKKYGIKKSESTPEEYTNNLSKAIQFDIKGNIKLNKEQNEKLNKLSEPEIEKFFTVLTGISKPETISAFKKLNKTAKIDALTYFIAKQGKNRKEDVKNIFKPHEGELRHFTDGDYIYTSGHWKKIKI
jgi:hypothetical protein